VDLIVTDVDWLEPDAVRLRDLQQAELHARSGGDGEPGTADGTMAGTCDVALFLLGRDRLTGAAVVCGGLRPLEPGVAEIKRMYVVPEHRGQGLSRVMLAELEREAAALGWSVLRLETGASQPEAIALYTGAGYLPIPRFGEHTNVRQSICFEKHLRPGTTPGAGGTRAAPEQTPWGS
jgi:GNAT superfamily N-acetyltransferase